MRSWQAVGDVRSAEIHFISTFVVVDEVLGAEGLLTSARIRDDAVPVSRSLAARIWPTKPDAPVMRIFMFSSLREFGCRNVVQLKSGSFLSLVSGKRREKYSD